LAASVAVITGDTPAVVIMADAPAAAIMADTLAAVIMADTLADTAAAVLAPGNRGVIATDSIEAAKTPVAADIRPQTTQSISGMAMQPTARDLLGDTRPDTSSTAVITVGID